MSRPIRLLLALAALLPGFAPAAHAASDAAELSGSGTLVAQYEQGSNLFEFHLKNTGDRAWGREGTGANPVNLGTVDNADSPFHDAATWHSGNRIAMVQDTVQPGETAIFRFAVRSPDAAGAARSRFRLVREQVGFFGPELTITNGVAGQAAAPTSDKKAEINLRNNTLTMWEGDRKIATHRISPGKWDTPTPVGTFTILNQERTRWSRTYKLFMPYWNHFGDGYGIHGLPYWVRRGRVVVEGANHIGRNVSHGCIRLGPGADKQFFQWASAGTTVWIHR